jgi:hypothetical protein
MGSEASTLTAIQTACLADVFAFLLKAACHFSGKNQTGKSFLALYLLTIREILP